jgi:hypothetical protein
MRRKSNPFFSYRDWESIYEGLPNAEILDVTTDAEKSIVQVRLESGDVIERTVGHLEYVVGRRGSLDYLDPELRNEVLGDGPLDTPSPEDQASTLISGRTLRAKAEADLEVAPNVFITGSLAGYSLVRHAVGGCVYAAGHILDPARRSTGKASPDSASTPARLSPSASSSGTPTIRANGSAHQDLHLDRRELTRAIDIASAENRIWEDSGWWGSGWRIT